MGGKRSDSDLSLLQRGERALARAYGIFEDDEDDEDELLRVGGGSTHELLRDEGGSPHRLMRGSCETDCSRLTAEAFSISTLASPAAHAAMAAVALVHTEELLPEFWAESPVPLQNVLRDYTFEAANAVLFGPRHLRLPPRTMRFVREAFDAYAVGIYGEGKGENAEVARQQILDELRPHVDSALKSDTKTEAMQLILGAGEHLGVEVDTECLSELALLLQFDSVISTANALEFVLLELARNTDLSAALREEQLALHPSTSATRLPTSASLAPDASPVLALAIDTLRRHPPLPEAAHPPPVPFTTGPGGRCLTFLALAEMRLLISAVSRSPHTLKLQVQPGLDPTEDVDNPADLRKRLARVTASASPE